MSGNNTHFHLAAASSACSTAIPKSMASGTNLNALPYVPYVAYNGTIPTGGNSLKENLNVFYESGDIAWMITSTALVLLMIPGVG